MTKILLQRIDCLQKSGDSGADDLFLKIYVDGSSDFTRWPSKGTVNIRSGGNKYLDLPFDFTSSLRIECKENDSLSGNDFLSGFTIHASDPVSGTKTNDSDVSSKANYTLDYVFIATPIKTLRIHGIYCEKEAHLIDKAVFDAIMLSMQAVTKATALALAATPVPGARAAAAGFKSASKVMGDVKDVVDWLLDTFDGSDQVYMTHISPERGAGGGFFPPNDVTEQFYRMKKDDQATFEDLYGSYARFPLDQAVTVQIREYNPVFGDLSMGALTINADHPVDQGAQVMVASEYFEGESGGHGALYLCYSVGMEDWTKPAHSDESTVSEIQPLPINMEQTISGTWDADIYATHRAGCYAKYYTFTVDEYITARISLESDACTYLYLLHGSEIHGGLLMDNAGGDDSPNSEIVYKLAPGSYTIEATTMYQAATGSFVVSLTTCAQNIPLNGKITSNWDGGTVSKRREGCYAKYFTLLNFGPQMVKISLKSDINTHLYLLRGTSPECSVIVESNDAGDPYISEIVHTLSLGEDYMIEVVTRDPGTTGSFEVTASKFVEVGYIPINMGQALPDVWVPEMRSSRRVGSYAKYFTFSVDREMPVRITLKGYEVYPFLYLISGLDVNVNNTEVLASNMTGMAETDSDILYRLSPGSYTIEATTYSSGKVGPFEISLSDAKDQLIPISIGQSLSGTWEAENASRHRKGCFAKYYGFEVATETTVKISLNSSGINTYLYLLRGEANLGNTIDESYGATTEDKFDSEIVKKLPAGRYIIEAVTVSPDIQGAFNISLA
jgi:hypothetical protein